MSNATDTPKRLKRTNHKRKSDPLMETSKSIAEQTRVFLESGGKIEKINSGVSGYRSGAAKKQIILSPEGNKN